MEYTDAAISYALLLIPIAFAGVMISQGVAQMKRKEPSGKIILGMGVFFLLIIPVVYFFLTKV